MSRLENHISAIFRCAGRIYEFTISYCIAVWLSLIALSLYSLSNKMDNFLLAVRVINCKYIVVERKYVVLDSNNII